jgi:hypothetical protein
VGERGVGRREVHIWDTYPGAVTAKQLRDALAEYCQEDVLMSFLYPPLWLTRLVAGHSPRRTRVRFWARPCCAGVREGGTRIRVPLGTSVDPGTVYFTNTPDSFVYCRHCTVQYGGLLSSSNKHLLTNENNRVFVTAGNSNEQEGRRRETVST